MTWAASSSMPSIRPSISSSTLWVWVSKIVRFSLSSFALRASRSSSSLRRRASRSSSSFRRCLAISSNSFCRAAASSSSSFSYTAWTSASVLSRFFSSSSSFESLSAADVDRPSIVAWIEARASFICATSVATSVFAVIGWVPRRRGSLKTGIRIGIMRLIERRVGRSSNSCRKRVSGDLTD